MRVTLFPRLVQLDAEGLLLRHYAPEDLSVLERAFADPDIARWNPGVAGPDAAATFMASRNDWSTADHFSWAVDSGGLVGSVSVFKVDTDQADAEIGYWVAPWARGHGVAARAVRAAAAFGFEQAGLERIVLYHAVDNPASCAVARSAGFVQEGTLRQSFRYGDGARHDEHLHARLRTDC